MTAKAIVLVKGEVVNFDPAIPVFDLTFLEVNQKNDQDEIKDAVNQATDTVFGLIRAGVYEYAAPVIEWLAAMDTTEDLSEPEEEQVAEDTNGKRGVSKRFTDDEIREIRARKGTSNGAIAEIFHTTPVTIANIRARKTYKDVK